MPQDDDFPTAARIDIGVCANPECRAVHIQLKDENDKIFAGAALHVDVVASFVQKIQSVAYEIAVLKEEK